MGAPWIPQRYVNQFADELLGIQTYRRRDDPFYIYVDATGEWKNTRPHLDADEAKLTSEYGTSRVPADKLILTILNGKLIEVKDKGEDDKTVRNQKETMAAQDKAAVIQAKFREWIWDDPERAEVLLRSYNDTFNGYRIQQYDGRHQALPGMDKDWYEKMHSHQKDAVWRVVQDRTALLAHEVGFDKTAVMVAR